MSYAIDSIVNELKSVCERVSVHCDTISDDDYFLLERRVDDLIDQINAVYLTHKRLSMEEQKLGSTCFHQI